jgi:hypothetical protein
LGGGEEEGEGEADLRWLTVMLVAVRRKNSGGDVANSKRNRERKTVFLLSFSVFFRLLFFLFFFFVVSFCFFLFFSSVFLSFPFYVSPCFSFSVPLLFSLLFFSSFPLLSPGIYKGEKGERDLLPLSNNDAGIGWPDGH